MKFYSTNNTSYQIDLKEAVIKGLSPDQGLFMPERIPVLSPEFLKNISAMTFREMSYEVISALFAEDLTPEQVHQLVDHTLIFDAPMVEVEEGIFSLELFHGPTLAFKDFGARFCSQLMSLLMKEEDRKVKVLVATSGDTGSAVANGFYQVPGVEVVILYPKGLVSPLQEMQFTTLGENINCLEVEGVFDDCQRMVKEAFLDEELNCKMLLTSANSINIARWIPQCLYYFYAFSRLPKSNKKIVFSVPSGNFGNLAAGILAQRMGLKIDVFLAATNINNVVPEYLSGSSFEARPSQATLSNSMDVGNPSNFYRLLDLYQGDENMLRNFVKGYYFDDQETAKAIREVYSSQGYLMEPHGAIGYLGLKRYLKDKSDLVGVFLETAHPAKFKSAVEKIIAKEIPLPANLEKFTTGKKKTLKISNNYADFKYYLQKNHLI
jgi:threonine synthase